MINKWNYTLKMNEKREREWERNRTEIIELIEVRERFAEWKKTSENNFTVKTIELDWKQFTERKISEWKINQTLNYLIRTPNEKRKWKWKRKKRTKKREKKKTTTKKREKKKKRGRKNEKIQLCKENEQLKINQRRKLFFVWKNNYPLDFWKKKKKQKREEKRKESRRKKERKKKLNRMEMRINLNEEMRNILLRKLFLMKLWSRRENREVNYHSVKQ